MSDPNQVWPQVLQQLQPSTRALLSQQGCLLNLTSKEAIVGLTEQWHKNIKSKLVNLEAGFEAVLGYKVQVRLEAVSSTKPKSEAASPPANLVPANPATLEYTSEPSTSPQRKLADSPVSEAPFTPDWASQVSESPESWQEDEVTRSARQLADFFNGKVVDLDEAVPASAEATPTQTTVQETSLISDSWQPSEDSENIDEDDDDVPF
jgi:DNA polymerase-3 subunit gamma/tau